MRSEALALSAIQAERTRRDKQAEECRIVLGRILEPAAPDQWVKMTEVKRLLQLCGIKLKSPEVCIAVQERFPQSKWQRIADARYPYARCFSGVRMRPGFSAVKLVAYLKSRHKSCELVQQYERVLSEEGMPDDIKALWDPGDGRQAMNRTFSYRSPDALSDIGFKSAIVEQMREEGEYALSLPGFFDGNERQKTIWRLYMVEGMTLVQIAKLLDVQGEFRVQAVHNVVKRIRKRLAAFREHAPDGDVPEKFRNRQHRYLWANKWQSDVERQVWELTYLGLRTPLEIAKELQIPKLQVVQTLRKHRARRGKALDRL